MTISGYHDVPENNEQSLLKALANQPLSVAIEASGRDFQFYSGVCLVNAYLFNLILLWSYKINLTMCRVFLTGIVEVNLTMVWQLLDMGRQKAWIIS